MTQELDLGQVREETGPAGSLRDRLQEWIKGGRNFLFGIASVGSFLLLWQIAGSSNWVDPLFISSPSLIWNAARQLAVEGLIWNDMWVSGQEFLIGFGLAVLVGIPLGILLGWYRTLNAALEPFVSFFYATPRVALLPLIIIWIGIGIWSKVALVFLGAVFPILITTETGMRTIDGALLKAARSFGANDRQIFATIALPSSVPFILAGLRLGVGRALIGVVVGELYAANAGVGYMIARAGAVFQTSKVFVGVLIIAGTAIILMEILKQFERRFERWRPERN